MRITITGGKGFIGSATADAAEAVGHEVAFFDRRDGNDIMGPLDALEGSDAVIHLAGLLGTMELFEDVERAVEVNVVGSLRIMEWCAERGAHYVGILVPFVFPSIYCATKRATAELASALHKADTHALRVSHVTAFNAYGPGQAYGPGHPQKFMPTFSIAAWNNRPIPIWGDGSNLIDAPHVTDIGRMLVDAARDENDDDVTFDGGTGTSVTVQEMAEFILDVTGSTAGIEYLPMRIGEAERANVPATGRGWDRLDWRPEFSWDKVKETVLWYGDREIVDVSGTR